MLYFISSDLFADGWRMGGMEGSTNPRLRGFSRHYIQSTGSEKSFRHTYMLRGNSCRSSQYMQPAKREREREHTVRRTGKPHHRKRPTSRQIRRRKIQRPRRLWYGGLPRANPLLDTFRIYTSIFLLTLGLHMRTSIAKRDSLSEKPYSAMDPRAFGGGVFRLPQAVQVPVKQTESQT